MGIEKGDNKFSIGIIDSGVGGLSITQSLVNSMPNLSICYVGDSKYFPYGEKNSNIIQGRVSKISSYLISKGVKLIVIACNSATINGIKFLREKYPNTFFIGVEPGIKPASNFTKNKKIGLLATKASLKGEKLSNLISEISLDKNVRIIKYPCSKFVGFVESGRVDGEEVNEEIKKVLSDLFKYNVDTIVLGCTHYYFLKDSINNELSGNINIIDTTLSVVNRIKDIYQENYLNDFNEEKNSIINIETTGNIDKWDLVVNKLMDDRFSYRIKYCHI